MHDTRNFHRDTRKYVNVFFALIPRNNRNHLSKASYPKNAPRKETGEKTPRLTITQIVSKPSSSKWSQHFHLERRRFSGKFFTARSRLPLGYLADSSVTWAFVRGRESHGPVYRHPLLRFTGKFPLQHRTSFATSRVTVPLFLRVLPEIHLPARTPFVIRPRNFLAFLQATCK